MPSPTEATLVRSALYMKRSDALPWARYEKSNFAPSFLPFCPGFRAAFACRLRAQAPVPDSPAIEAQAHAMLSKLTLEQKIELLGGINSMYTRPMPAIDLPRFKMSDASVGVRTWGPTTAYAGGSALAASWDTDLARKIGEGLGRDARARNVNFLLGPGVNIARSPISRPQLRVPV